MSEAPAVRTVVTVVGARPQFVKAAAVCREIARFNASGAGVRVEERLIHTGQHYDSNMSRVFFDQLQIPAPWSNLEVGSGTHGQQTAAMLERIEAVLLELRPDWVLVYGDTNSTLAGALAAVKLHIPVAHVEAGLRSFNWGMPEEVNRIVADRLSSLLLCPTRTAVRNLASEGLVQGVSQVGDVMYDSVLFHAEQATKEATILSRLGLVSRSYYLATVHRAENTDDPARLAGILDGLGRLRYPVVLPLHPRTRKVLERAGVRQPPNLVPLEPVAYLDMLQLEGHARVVLTDSGGVQKEAYWFEVPCVTLRHETEWVELVETGCNAVVGTDAGAIARAVQDWEQQNVRLPAGRPPDLYGDGRSAGRIVRLLAGVEERPRRASVVEAGKLPGGPDSGA